MMGKQLVHFHIYNPKEPSLFKSSNTDHAKAYFVWCSLESPCPLRAKGQCIQRRPFGPCCPYGSSYQREGPTKRSSQIGVWVARQRKEAGDNPPTLQPPNNVVAVIGDYIWLPYAHMDFERDTPTLKIQMFGGRNIIPVSDLTPAVVKMICEWRPQAIFGGEIKNYQAESVPQFVRHLREIMPDLYAATLTVYPKLAEILAKTTDIGRKAILGTLAPNVGQFVDIYGGHWTWDGTWLVSVDSKMAFGLASKFTEIRVKADLGCEVVVTDEAQVLPTTEFRS